MTKSNPYHPAIILGLAGLLPQILCLAIIIIVPEWHWLAITAACFYAATILSFLGGMWWMQGLAAACSSWKPYLLGALPSLIAWGALLPWAFGWTWPGPSLIVLGIALLISPLADRALDGKIALPPWWARLRWTLAGGLGGLSIIIGLIV